MSYALDDATNDVVEFDPEGVLFAASTGGHFQQSILVARQLGNLESSRWITFDHPQTRSMRSEVSMAVVPYIGSRDYAGLLRASRGVVREIRQSSASTVVSTGAAIALIALPVAVLLRRRAVYIESVSRVEGPSTTGRILRYFPGISMYCQHPRWAGGAWKLWPSVLAAYKRVSRPGSGATPRTIFVTVGTLKQYRFDRLLRSLAELGGSFEFVWQVGCTDGLDLPGTVHTSMASAEFDDAVRTSDVVITHAGVGSILRILELGRYPIVCPRESSRGEHIDDHQFQICRLVSETGVGLVVDADQVSSKDIDQAAGYGVEAA
ncbi:glycosyltransferase [Gordonia alkanivorans]|uniref:glycosyltransferase n=1 Tax=Gordonia alkanivorans TaxID=84096 RepID=UPI0024487C72|nr:glycosyltransferase [Gordonia alkanivorans]MDH3046686.1 glycosyltransferase [Gordonia alkanivorans]MDJ0010342.1 glycosyltransferase [Gordonia alkanivorans]MDJ0100111.1 glycosyltransferase [Gordonia alkanivorans]MDJ0495976.1 glycosyltransferase [Gordonia alkanivorans]